MTLRGLIDHASFGRLWITIYGIENRQIIGGIGEVVSNAFPVPENTSSVRLPISCLVELEVIE